MTPLERRQERRRLDRVARPPARYVKPPGCPIHLILLDAQGRCVLCEGRQGPYPWRHTWSST